MLGLRLLYINSGIGHKDGRPTFLAFYSRFTLHVNSQRGNDCGSPTCQPAECHVVSPRRAEHPAGASTHRGRQPDGARQPDPATSGTLLSASDWVSPAGLPVPWLGARAHPPVRTRHAHVMGSCPACGIPSRVSMSTAMERSATSRSRPVRTHRPGILASLMASHNLKRSDMRPSAWNAPQDHHQGWEPARRREWARIDFPPFVG